VQHLRQRAERNTLVKDIFKFCVAPRDGIPDHDEIWPRSQVGFGKRLCQRDAQRFEKSGHRRIGRGIGTSDTMAARFEHPGERRHRRAADANQMDVFGFVFHV